MLPFHFRGASLIPGGASFSDSHNISISISSFWVTAILKNMYKPISNDVDFLFFFKPFFFWIKWTGISRQKYGQDGQEDKHWYIFLFQFGSFLGWFATFLGSVFPWSSLPRPRLDRSPALSTCRTLPQTMSQMHLSDVILSICRRHFDAYNPLFSFICLIFSMFFSYLFSIDSLFCLSW